MRDDLFKWKMFMPFDYFLKNELYAGGFEII